MNQLLNEIYQHQAWADAEHWKVLDRRLLVEQAAMHSHYHRGQNSARVRELGIEPPLTDYIVWLWKK